MNELGVYTTVAISILGVAYPILLQVISTLDEKYSSIQVVELFDKEKEKKGFYYLLIASLVAVLIWSFKFPPMISIKGLGYLINNSASLFLISTSVLLVVCFFFLVDKTFVYLTPIKFANYLINKHRKDNGELKYFKALADVFLKSVQSQNHGLSQTISRFLYEDFKNQREKHGNAPVEFPDVYYSLVHKAIEELAIIKDKKNIALEYRTAGGVWLLGETGGFEISEKTYSWLWHNILLAVKYEQDDMVMYHWERAHQYITFALRYIQPEYARPSLEITNNDAVEQRKMERERFLDFHYALGGLLLYKKRYACLNRMFSYTTSEPPSYELLPTTMWEVFTNYMKYRNPYGDTWISHRYPFPGMEGIKSDSLIVRWISSYFGLLLLRQYAIYPYLITTKPLDFPMSPKQQSEKRKWIDSLDFFKKLTTEHFENVELLETVKYKFITPDWCNVTHKPYPLDFISSLKSKLEEEYEQGAVNMVLSEEKKNQFFSTSKAILEKKLNAFLEVSNKQGGMSETNNWYIKGSRMVQSKDAFSENSEAHHTDFDTFLAYESAKEINEGIASTFLSSRTKSYLLKPEDIFPSIDKLGATNDFVIITFGIDLTDYINHRKTSGLTDKDYRGINYYTFPGSFLVNDSIFIVRKNKLPTIKTLKPEEEEIQKYSLQNISDQFNLYSSVLDLNKVVNEIRIENSQTKSDEELRKSVLLNLLFTVEISWIKGTELIQLMEYSEYRQDGVPNSLSEVSPASQIKK